MTTLGTSSTFSKDVLPRAAALLDAPMVTDVVGIEEMDGSISYRRPINAGSMLATVKVEGDAGCSQFAPPPSRRRRRTQRLSHRTVRFRRRSLPNGMQFISREQRASDRPDLTEARVVVSAAAAEGPGNIRATGRRIGGRT